MANAKFHNEILVHVAGAPMFLERQKKVRIGLTVETFKELRKPDKNSDHLVWTGSLRFSAKAIQKMTKAGERWDGRNEAEGEKDQNEPT